MSSACLSLFVAPVQVIRGSGALSQAGAAIARLGSRPLIVGGDRTLTEAGFVGELSVF